MIRRSSVVDLLVLESHDMLFQLLINGGVGWLTSMLLSAETEAKCSFYLHLVLRPLLYLSSKVAEAVVRRCWIRWKQNKPIGSRGSRSTSRSSKGARSRLIETKGAIWRKAKRAETAEQNPWWEPNSWQSCLKPMQFSKIKLLFTNQNCSWKFWNLRRRGERQSRICGKQKGGCRAGKYKRFMKSLFSGFNMFGLTPRAQYLFVVSVRLVYEACLTCHRIGRVRV